MGKSRPRLKKSKGKRWGKGQSSSSNPETRRFRDLARRGYFLPPSAADKGGSLLTAAALKVHDTGSASTGTPMEEDDSRSVVTDNTLDSYASVYSNCSNQSFNRLFRTFRSDSAFHKDMLAVLAAVTEVIQSQGGSETDAEYFGALVTSMEVMDSEETLTAAASLLGMGMRRLHPAVLNVKFPETSKLFMDLLEKWAPVAGTLLIKSLIGCLSQLLRAQEQGRWKEPFTMHCYNAILTSVIHPKPKIRKASQHALCAILKGSRFMLDGAKAPAHHPAAVVTAEYLIKQVEGLGLTSPDSMTSTLHVLGLMRETLPCFPSSHVKSACESILKVIKLGNVLSLSCGLKAIHGLMLSKPSTSTLPAKLNAQLISALTDYKPPIHDAQPLAAWVSTMEQAHLNLHRLDSELSLPHIIQFSKTCSSLWLSDRTEVHAASANAIQNVLQKCYLDPVVLQQMFTHLQEGLKYQYHPAWGHVFATLACFFQVSREKCVPYISGCLRTMVDLRSAPNFSFTRELDTAIGQAITSLGPGVLMEAAPLKITGREEDDMNFNRSWLIPIMRDNIKNTELAFFTSYFMPLSVNCKQRAMKEGVDTTTGRAYILIYQQVWSLLPGFCTDPTDVATAFGSIAKTMGLSLKNKEIQKDVLSALRNLIKSSSDKPQQKEQIGRFAKNFLPILFSMYTSEDRNAQVLETICYYLQVTEPSFIENLFTTAMNKFTAARTDNTLEKELMLDLSRIMIKYLNKESLNKLHEKVLVLLANKDKRLQKRAYRVLDDMCACESEGCREFVQENFDGLQKLLLSLLSSTNPTARAPRLRCLATLCDKLTSPRRDFIKAVVPEAILCVKDNNHKARAAAYKLLVCCGKALQRWSNQSFPDDLMKDLLEVMLPGLATTPTGISATLLSLSHVFFNFQPLFPIDTGRVLLDDAFVLLKSPSREIVQSALEFVKTYIMCCAGSVVEIQLPNVINALYGMNEDCKRHFRLKTRDIFSRLIRKFGYQSVKALVPPEDVVLLKRLKNLHKIEERKARLKKIKDAGGENEGATPKEKIQSIEDLLAESDSDLEDKENEGKKPATTTTAATSSWIQERPGEVVDLLDPEVSQRLTSTQPKDTKKKKSSSLNSGAVVMGSDGKLIIRNDEGEDSEDDSDVDSLDESGNPGKRKRNTSESDEEETLNQYQAGGTGIHRPISKTPRAVGDEYKSKKAGGDVKKKGRPDPYAYVQLNPRQLNRRKRAKFAGQFKGLVHGIKRGAVKGAKLKRKKKKTI